MDASAMKKEMATHFSIFAWKIPRTEEPGIMDPSPWGRRESDTTDRLTCQIELKICRYKKAHRLLEGMWKRLKSTTLCVQDRYIIWN